MYKELVEENQRLKEALSKTILVWQYENAPLYYQQLSTHGGDEDWVAFVPDTLGYIYIDWLQSGTPFGCCDVYEYKVNDGTVYIGAHA